MNNLLNQEFNFVNSENLHFKVCQFTWNDPLKRIILMHRKTDKVNKTEPNGPKNCGKMFLIPN